MEFDLAPQMKKMENELLSVNLANGIIKKSRKQGKDIDEYIKSNFH